MIRLGILFGGRSGEHEISLMSAASVLRVLDSSRFTPVMIGITKEGKWLLYDGPADAIETGEWQAYAEEALARAPERYGVTILGAGGKSLSDLVDFVLPIVHGPYCEDGKLQGLLEMMDIPYGGSGVLGSALAMDKIAAKNIFASAGLTQTAFVPLEAPELEDMERCKQLLDEIELKLHYPLFVKPANMGSSVGVYKVQNREDLLAGLKKAAAHDRRLLVEQGIAGRELETVILGNENPKAGAVGEIKTATGFYDYETKYFKEGAAETVVPADIPEQAADAIREMAIHAYRLLDCAGFARVDFFLEEASGLIYINEINTIPGFTRISMFPKLWECAGLPYQKQIETIVELGYERYYAKNRRQTNHG